MARLVDASDRAVLVVFDDTMTPAAGRDVRLLEAWLREEPPVGIVDLNPAYASLLVRYDPLRCSPEALSREILRRVESLARRAEPEPRSFEIPVLYGGASGPDLQTVAREVGLSAEAFVLAHAAASYEVRFIGFSPGFPYLAGLPERLHTARKSAPRACVPAGSVAIAGAQAGIYPVTSPGGWNLIGRTDFVLFDPNRARAATLAAGDRVCFRAAGGRS